MSDCTHLSDRMPAVARGASRWSSTDEAHLAACSDCAAEWALVRRTSVLGRSIEIRDPERITTVMLEALRTPAPRVRSGVLRWIAPVAIAAGLLLVLIRPRGEESPADSVALTLSLLPEAESLTEADLESVIRLIPAADPADRANAAALDSLNEDELTQMLKDIEG